MLALCTAPTAITSALTRTASGTTTFSRCRNVPNGKQAHQHQTSQPRPCEALYIRGALILTKHYPKGLDGRMRDGDGQIRQKRNDTLVGTLRREYGPGFAEAYRSDTKLKTVLEDAGVS